MSDNRRRERDADPGACDGDMEEDEVRDVRDGKREVRRLDLLDDSG